VDHDRPRLRTLSGFALAPPLGCNSIGSSELTAVWSDPDFDPKQKAFYYARVIEIPTPRWSTYDAFRYGIEIPEGAPTTTQERGYTSPIWYAPN